MIRKSGCRFSLATNAERVCAEIMLKQIDEIMMRFFRIMISGIVAAHAAGSRGKPDGLPHFMIAIPRSHDD